MKHFVIINLLVFVILFVVGLCQDQDQQTTDDDITTEVTKVLKQSSCSKWDHLE